MEATAVAGDQAVEAAVVMRVPVVAAVATLVPAEAMAVCFHGGIATIGFKFITVHMVPAVDPMVGMAPAADRMAPAADRMAPVAVRTVTAECIVVGVPVVDRAVVPVAVSFMRHPSTKVPSRSTPPPCKKVPSYKKAGL